MSESTSIASYQEAMIEGLISSLHLKVLQYFESRPGEPICQGEVSRHFKDVTSSFQPRFKELERNGAIEVVGTKIDTLTRRTVKMYQLTRKMPKKNIKIPRKVKLARALAERLGGDAVGYLNVAEYCLKKLRE